MATKRYHYSPLTSVETPPVEFCNAWIAYLDAYRCGVRHAGDQALYQRTHSVLIELHRLQSSALRSKLDPPPYSLFEWPEG